MLDTDTKRRIDTARDILVGKVPDPKSQVEQITIALIYKFMDDMDAESEEFGGKRKFFAGEFARYGWVKLMRSGLGGHEILSLYTEAIAKMPENPGIPLLFRDIFKNAYLPYRDPETLRAFLKIIDEFTYEHSERLGDAYEYLLSVLGSQGDAGQFRTPRHIIDFIVAILDPKKTEKVLDPACGTSGFLISSYKHILKTNSSPEGIQQNGGKRSDEDALHTSKIPPAKGDLLTPDEKGRLATNFKGYDISPDMVRLSLVNLYLHGFTDPHIFEYDTLTSQDRWNEYADVILANPPFMSPKGGIKPHNRFSVQSKRSELLFVDYMAEHLTPTGRAGIIVPEGIIFQSQNAYTQLRKMLVEEYLVAVISLPAGVFNPYSGVKTSILILDKSLAKKTNTIAFFKIENDGFGLGAQRRRIEKNDLSQALAELNEYLWCLRSQESVEDLLPTLGLIVPKEKIVANGEYNLSGERYREGGIQTGSYPWRKLELLVETITPPCKIQKTAFGTRGRFPIIDQSQERIAGWTDDETALVRPRKPLVIFGDHTCAVKLVETPFAQGADGIKILQTVETLDPRYLFQVIRARPLESAGYQRHYSLLKEMEIPLPPMEMQKEIVAEIDGYQKVIDGARAVLDNYRPHIPIHPDWPKAELGKICDVRDGTHDSPKYVLEGYPLITSKNLKNGFIDFSDVNLISRENLDEINKRSKVDEGDILMPMIGTIGNPVIADTSREYAVKNVALIKFKKNSEVDNRFLKDVLGSAEMQCHFDLQASGSTQRFIPLGFIRSLPVPLPPIATQQAIVAEIEAEQVLVAATRELIKRFEKKIQATLAIVWGGEIGPGT
ncbi:MAG: N-6 DNA methylase [Nitrospirales bacterium]|nr:N-6 DNA methylase [Nitrospirales bacterium]